MSLRAEGAEEARAGPPWESYILAGRYPGGGQVSHMGWLCGSVVGGMWMATVLGLESGTVTRGLRTEMVSVW